MLIKFEKYFSLPPIKRSENLIESWKYTNQEFARLKLPVLKYLISRLNSVTTERCFSAAKEIHTDNENCFPNNVKNICL